MNGATRNVLEEAARIARGDIQGIALANAAHFDAVIVPGELSAAKNLCAFAVDSPEMTVNPVFSAFMQAAKAADKTIGLMCIAPAMSAKLLGEGVDCTIGNDADTTAAVEKPALVMKAAQSTPLFMMSPINWSARLLICWRVASMKPPRVLMPWSKK